MNRRPVDTGDPDRLYTVTGGRTRSYERSFDLVTLIVRESAPSIGMQSEHVRILDLCERPVAVVELASLLDLPVGVVKILLCDLLDSGRITARHPQTGRGRGGTRLPPPDTLKKVLIGLRNL